MVDFPVNGAGRVTDRTGSGTDGENDLKNEFLRLEFSEQEAEILSDYFAGKSIEEVYQVLSAGQDDPNDELIDEEQMKALASLLAELLENGDAVPIDELLNLDGSEVADKEKLKNTLTERLFSQSDGLNAENLEQILLEAGINPAEAKSLSKELKEDLKEMSPEDTVESVLEILTMSG